MNDTITPPCLAKVRQAATAIKAEKWHSLSLSLETITPVVGGGTVAGEPDLLLPFRPRAIKNSLRHWWWLINRQKAEYKDEKGCGLLYKEITAIWGGAAEVNKESKSSNIRINVISTPLSDQQIVKSTEYRDLTYALWMTIQGQDQQQGWPLIKPGYTFSLKIEIKKELTTIQIDDVLCAINAWLHFGGVGARTTRGLGKLKLVLCTGDLSNSVKSIFNFEDVWYKSFKRSVPQPPQIRLCDSRNLTALQALGKSVLIYKTFRQARQNGEVTKRNGDTLVTRVNRSYWPKADVIRFQMDQANPSRQRHTFHLPHTNINSSHLPIPEILFGAPINYKFKPNEYIPEGAINFKHEEIALERYASPLIVTVLRTANDVYAPAALILPFWNDVRGKGIGIGIAGLNTILPTVWWPDTSQLSGKGVAQNILAGSVMHLPVLFNDARSDPLREALISAASEHGNPLASFLKFFKEWNAQIT